MSRRRRVIFHIDVNSAFLSWTAVQLMQSGHQDIRLVPSVVSGDPNDRRSIITAASIPAKKLGIKTAEPVSMALRKCPNLIVVQGDWEWYRRCSEGFIEICRRYSPVLQQFSIDECFIDMSLRNWGEDPVDVAIRLKNEVKATLGFTVNVGIGSNKLLAKMASEFEKPDKVQHGLDGASLEGTKDRDRFTFILWMGLWHIVNRTLRCTVMTIRIRINIVGYTLENRNPTMTNWYTLAAYASTFNCHLISKIEISHPQTKGWDYLIYG